MSQVPTEDLEHILTRTVDLWQPLRGQRIFLTGGTGFFGRWLLEAFCRANEEFGLNATVVVLTRDPNKAAQQFPHLVKGTGVEFHPGDFRSFAFPNGEFSYLIHAATETDSFVAPIERGLLFDANIGGTHRVLEFARSANVRRLLYVSSGAVYGRQPLDVLRISEDSPVAPDTMDIGAAYGHGKRASEFLFAAHAARTGQSIAAARCFAFVGPHLPLDVNYAIGNFMGDAMRGGPIRISGDGTPLRSYLYMADLAVWLWTILIRGEGSQVYNVGSDVVISIEELARLVATVVAPNVEVEVARAPTPGAVASRYVPSIERARGMLGLDVWIDLASAIDKTASWYRRREH